MEKKMCLITVFILGLLLSAVAGARFVNLKGANSIAMYDFVREMYCQNRSTEPPIIVGPSSENHAVLR